MFLKNQTITNCPFCNKPLKNNGCYSNKETHELFAWNGWTLNVIDKYTIYITYNTHKYHIYAVMAKDRRFHYPFIKDLTLDPSINYFANPTEMRRLVNKIELIKNF